MVIDDARTECDAAYTGSTYPPLPRIGRHAVNRGVASRTACALVENVLARVSFTHQFDTGICGYLRGQTRGIVSRKHSAEQHLGPVAGERF